MTGWYTRDIVISLLATYGLYLISSLLFFDVSRVLSPVAEVR